MLNKLRNMIRRYEMVQPGDTVVCAVSGGADSVALLWGMYLLKEKLQITLQAAHFNHHLRGAESDRDQAFVQDLCDRFDIPLTLGSGQVVPGEKGLEAAAREARYGFLEQLPGKIATAHTADDNAETVLMHLVRGTGLKGLGGIAPVRGRLIRPMLEITREEVLAFLGEYHLTFVEDSSNAGDTFLRNRLRHRVMPLLKEENPRLAENVSEMAQRLRMDEQALTEQRDFSRGLDLSMLEALPEARQHRVVAEFLRYSGVREPEGAHIALALSLARSDRPSAAGDFPGGVRICRRYGYLVRSNEAPLEPVRLQIPGVTEIPGWRITCLQAEKPENTSEVFTVEPCGEVWVRSRQSGDAMRLSGGTRTLKKLFIDRKIPRDMREQLPVVVDGKGIVGVWGIGAHEERKIRMGSGLQIRFEKRKN
jgi:tRNA(Ile)-lysidine synthase